MPAIQRVCNTDAAPTLRAGNDIITPPQANTKNPQLNYEAKLYSRLQGGIGIPAVKYYGVEGDFNVMVMDLLGPSLEDLFNYCGRKFSVKSVMQVRLPVRPSLAHSRVPCRSAPAAGACSLHVPARVRPPKRSHAGGAAARRRAVAVARCCDSPARCQSSSPASGGRGWVQAFAVVARAVGWLAVPALGLGGGPGR